MNPGGQSGGTDAGAGGDDAVHDQAADYVVGRDAYLAGRDQHFHHGPGVRRVRAAGDDPDTGCPYPGLAAFTAEQAQWFFGRDELTSDLLGRLNGHLGEGGPVMVVGASGAGKSSLLRAGLLHKVAAGGLTEAGSRHWPRIVFAPGAHPMREAAAALQAGLPAGAGGAVTAEPGPDALDGLLRRAVEAAIPESGLAARAVIVVDQFEELFTLCGSEGERRAFISWLWRTAGGDVCGGPLALVACGLRADFYGECSRYPELRQALTGDQVLVGPMSPGELTEAIVYPAQAAGLDIEPGLVEILLRDLGTVPQGDAGPVSGYEAGRLPLLAHALQAVWQQRHGSVLTVDGYRATGGISHAVQETAERAFRRLGPDARQETRTVFLRLIRIGDAGEDTRRRASQEDFLGDSPQPAVTQAVLDAFTSSRLLTRDRDAIEITHEALIRGWPRLRTWIDQDRASHLARQDLSEAAAAWDRSHRDPSYLYRGILLQAATATAARVKENPARYRQLSQTERSFLQASDRASRRAGRVRRTVIAGLTALTLAAVTAAGFAINNAADAARQSANAVQQADNAARQHAIALSRQLVADSFSTESATPVIARQLAVAAWSASPTDQAGTAISAFLAEQRQDGILPADPDLVNGVAFRPDGTILASADSDGTVRLWNPATDQPVGSPLQTGIQSGSGVNGVAFSPDGTILASADSDGTVRLWNAATGKPVGSPLQTGAVQNGVNGVTFSPDGTILASADSDGTVRLWNPATGKPIGKPIGSPSPPGTPGPMSTVAFSPDGKMLATTDNNTVLLWNPATGRLIRSFSPGNDPDGILAVAFSPDGRILATAANAGAVRLWNPATGKPIGSPLQTVSPDDSDVTGVAFSPDGKTLATASNDISQETSTAVVRVWDLATRQPIGAPLQTDSANGVTGVAFSPDGTMLASADGDGTVRLSSPATGKPIGSPFQTVTQSGVSGVAFSPDGTMLASAGNDGTVRLWNPATGKPVGAPLKTGAQHGVAAVAFSPDGKTLATAGNTDTEGTVRLWNPATGMPVGSPLQMGDHIGVAGVAFSPDGTMLASADSDGTVRLWNQATGKLIGSPLQAGPRSSGIVTGVAFSPDGKTLATASDATSQGASTGVVRVWNLATGKPIGSPIEAGVDNGVNGVAFSPDGKILATADGDGADRLWNPATGKPIGSPLQTNFGGNQGGALSFSPDSTMLAGFNGDGTVRLWNTATGKAIGSPLQTGAIPPGVNGVAFSPDGKILVTVNSSGGVLTWDISQFTRPYAALCSDVGQLSAQAWNQYAPGEQEPKICQ